MEMFRTLVSLACAAFALVFVWKVLNFLWFKPKKLEKFFRQQGLKGSSYRLLVGDLREMDMRAKEAKSKPIDFTADYVPRIMPFIHKTVTNCGPICYIWLGPFPSVVISKPDHMREILSKSYVYQKPYNPLANILVEGLASYDTDKWAKHRRLINPAFQLENIKNSMVQLFHLSCCDMLSKWDDIVPSEDGSIELDVWPFLQTLTRDVISRTSFGNSFEEGTKISELQTELINLLHKAILSAFIPGWRFLPTKTNRRIKKIRKDVEILVLGIIDKRMKALEEGEASSNNLLDILLESNLKEIRQNGNKFGMSLHDVIEECKLFYFAGQETTSSLLVWTMILLSKHVDWQARAREEVLQVCGSRAPDFHELNNLKTVTMIFHEVLRLYTPGLMLGRTIHKDTKLGNLTLPAGVQLLLPSVLVHHDPSIWGSDANEFNPDRFSEGVSKATQGSFTYFPFGWGPRICIGQNFAMFEAKMALVMILQHYSFELSPSYSHAPCTITTLQPQHGAHLTLCRL